MPSAAASHPQPADLACQQAEDALCYRAVLHELIDMGLDLARSVHQQATGPAGDAAAAPRHEAAEAFDRISRAVRRTVVLARKVSEPLPVRAAAGQDRAAARRRVIREVEDAIQRRAGGAEAEALHAELSERLDAPDLDDEIDNRPVAEIIKDICRDLGLAHLPGSHPWKRRTPDDVAALCARVAQPRAVPPFRTPSPVVAHTAPRRTEAGANPPALPHDAEADLLRFTFPVRGT